MKRNFTLLEVLLASIIMAMIVSALALGMNGIYASWSKVAKANYRLERFIVIDRIVDSAFRNAIPFTWRDKNNKDRLIFVGDKNELLLSYLRRINNPEDGALNFLRLKLKNGVLTAIYRKTPILWWENDSENLIKEEICAGINSISFLFADRDGDEIVWLDDWDEENSPNIPLAIQMRIDFDDGTTELWLRRTAGAGMWETLGQRRLR